MSDFELAQNIVALSPEARWNIRNKIVSFNPNYVQRLVAKHYGIQDVNQFKNRLLSIIDNPNYYLKTAQNTGSFDFDKTGAVKTAAAPNLFPKSYLLRLTKDDILNYILPLIFLPTSGAPVKLDRYAKKHSRIGQYLRGIADQWQATKTAPAGRRFLEHMKLENANLPQFKDMKDDVIILEAALKDKEFLNSLGATSRGGFTFIKKLLNSDLKKIFKDYDLPPSEKNLTILSVDKPLSDLKSVDQIVVDLFKDASNLYRNYLKNDRKLNGRGLNIHIINNDIYSRVSGADLFNKIMSAAELTIPFGSHFRDAATPRGRLYTAGLLTTVPPLSAFGIYKGVSSGSKDTPKFEVAELPVPIDDPKIFEDDLFDSPNSNDESGPSFIDKIKDSFTELVKKIKLDKLLS